MFTTDISAIRQDVLTRQTVGERFAIIAFVLFIASEIVFSYTSIPTTYAVFFFPVMCKCAVAICAILAIIIRPNTHPAWQWLLATATFGLLVLSAIRTRDYRFILTFMVLFSIAGIEMKKLCRTYASVTYPILIVVMLLSVSGLLHNSDRIPNTYLVFSYGFRHPNTVSALMLSSIGASTYANWNRRAWVVPLALTVVAAPFAFIMLSSKAPTVLLLLLAAINLVGHSRLSKWLAKPRPKTCFAILAIVPIVLLGLSLFCTVYYDASSSLFKWINSFFTGRLSLASQYYLANGGFPLLGRAHVAVALTVDNGYSWMCLVLGLLPTIALFATYLTAAWQIVKKGGFFVISYLVMAAFYLAVETVPLILPICFSVLFLSEAFANSDKGCVNR